MNTYDTCPHCGSTLYHSGVGASWESVSIYDSSLPPSSKDTGARDYNAKRAYWDMVFCFWGLSEREAVTMREQRLSLHRRPLFVPSPQLRNLRCRSQVLHEF